MLSTHVTAFLHGRPISGACLINATKHGDGKQEQLGKWKKYVCETCNNRTLNGTNEWQAHLRSKAHKQMIKKARKKNEERKDLLGSQYSDAKTT